MAKKLVKGKDYFVIHTLRDGRVLDSIDGYPVPVNEKTKIFYDTLADDVIKSSKQQITQQPHAG